MVGTGAKKLQVSRVATGAGARWWVAACIPSMQSKEAARQPRLTPEWRENGCKVLVLAVLVLQNSSLVLATTYARHREGELFLTTVLVFLGECIKTSVSVLCTVMTSGTSTGQVLHTSFVTEAHSLWRMAVPAVLYTFSNNLAMVAMSNLSAVAYQVANQLKIPATALMARLLLQRRISSLQWCAILLLVLGVILVQLKPGAPPTGRETHMMLGLAAVIANAVVGAFAGVWFEKIVKAARPDGRTTNLWVSNLQAASHNAYIGVSHGALQGASQTSAQPVASHLQLCLFSLPLSAAAVLLADFKAVRAGTALRGFDNVACLVRTHTVCIHGAPTAPMVC